MNQLSAYDSDFAAWIDTQRALLHAKQFNELDLANLIDELDAMGKNQRHEVRSRIETLLMHLLKCCYQPEHKSRSWVGTVHEQRSQILQRLDDSPSLRHLVDDFARQRYASAVRRAAAETGLPESRFPVENPWSAGQLLDPDFIP